MEQIPQDFQGLLTGKTFGHLVTLMDDGSPQTTPVWVDFDGTHVVINTVVGRLKDRNLSRDPRAAISIQDPGNPYRYLQVRGKVVEKTTDGADEHIDKLAQRYLGEETYPAKRPEDQRVIYRISTDQVQAYGG